MKIGVFDSGLGGLIVLRALARELQEYDYVYLGDTARVPYGNRSEEAIHRFLVEAVDFLFREGCALVIVACNTASAEALRKVQRGWLPRHYPDRRVLGVIIPTAEAALEGKRGKERVKRLGILATQGTVASKAYEREVGKLDPRVRVVQSAAPLLVPLIENGGAKWAEPMLREYLAPLIKARVDAVVLGCTHYPILKRKIRMLAGVPVVAQDECVPAKVRDYLARHPEMDRRLSKHGTVRLLVTDITRSAAALARRWFGRKARLEKVKID